MNQSELVVNTCNRRQAREDACEQETNGLGFTSDWSKKWSEIFNQSQIEVKQNQSKTRIPFDTQLKTALLINKVCLLLFLFVCLFVLE